MISILCVPSTLQALLECAKRVRMPHNGQPTQVRVGIHTGDVTTGLIGTKLPKFSVFGDTMNTVRGGARCVHSDGCTMCRITARLARARGSTLLKLEPMRWSDATCACPCAWLAGVAHGEHLRPR